MATTQCFFRGALFQSGEKTLGPGNFPDFPTTILLALCLIKKRPAGIEAFVLRHVTVTNTSVPTSAQSEWKK